MVRKNRLEVEARQKEAVAKNAKEICYMSRFEVLYDSLRSLREEYFDKASAESDDSNSDFILVVLMLILLLVLL